MCQHTSDSDSLGNLKLVAQFPEFFDHSMQLCGSGKTFEIYMSVKRLTFYLQDIECTILCKHKTLHKFLKGKTENNKVNNMLANCLSQLEDAKLTDCDYDPIQRTTSNYYYH